MFGKISDTKLGSLLSGSISGKNASLKPYFLAKNEPKFLVKFLHKLWFIFVPVNFWEKCKPIALVFGKILAKFFR